MITLMATSTTMLVANHNRTHTVSVFTAIITVIATMDTPTRR